MAMRNPPHPGEIVREDCMKPFDLPVTSAAKWLGVSTHALSELLKGRVPISADMALRLEAAGWSTAESWLSDQLAYDLWQARQTGPIAVAKFPVLVRLERRPDAEARAANKAQRGADPAAASRMRSV